MEELRDDEVRDLVVDRRAEEDDPLVEQARVDVERALAARGLLDHHRNQGAHSVSLLPGVHNFVSASGFLLVGCPELVSRFRELGCDGLDVGDEAVERGAEPEILADRLLLAVRPDVLDDAFRVVLARRRDLLADVRLHVVVGDLDARLLGERLERELARDRDGGLEHHLALELLALPPLAAR